MDSLIVDLDKVLDDFEAEETGGKGCPGQETKPSDFSSYVALKNDRPWEELSNVAGSTDPSWTVGLNHTNEMAAYDIPYSPSDQFDLSEADFAPATDYKTGVSENAAMKEKGAAKPAHLVMNGDHKLDLSQVITNRSQDYKYPIQARDEFTPVYENQPFPPDLAHAISNGVNKSNLTYIQEIGEKSEELKPSSQSYTYNTGIYTPPRIKSHQHVVPTTYPSVDNSIDSGVNSIDSNTTLSPTNLMLRPMPVHAGNFIQTQDVREVGSTSQTQSHEALARQENFRSVNPQAPHIVDNSEKRTGSSHNTDNEVKVFNQKSISGSEPRFDVNDTEGRPSNRTDLSGGSDGQVSSAISNRHPYIEGGESSSNEHSLNEQSIMSCDNTERNQDSSSVPHDINSTEPKNVMIQPNTALEVKGSVCDPVASDSPIGLSDTVEPPSNEGQLTLEQENSKESVPVDSSKISLNSELATLDSPSTVGFSTVTTNSKSAVGFCDAEVDISDMDNYLGDVSGNIEPDGQNASVHPEEPLIHTSDFTDSTQTQLQQSETESENVRTDKVIQPVSCDENVAGERLDLLNNGQETVSEQISQGDEFTTENSDIQNESTTSLGDQDLTSLPPNMGARPKEPQQPMATPPNEPPKALEAQPKEFTDSTVHSEQNTKENSLVQSEQVVNKYDSCVQNNDSVEEMDPDLAAAIALSLQESGLEGAVMRHPGDNGQLVDRPHSWGPGDGGTHQQRRPNSLNLPPRGEHGHERSSAPYTFPYPNNSETSPEVDGDPEIRASQDNPQDLNTLSEDIIPNEEPVGAGYNPSGVGRVAPRWIPDSEAPNCMGCEMKFTFTKRRHHCRACGKVYCSTCCNLKSRLPYMDNKEARVCVPCHQMIEADLCNEADQGMASGTGERPLTSPPTSVLKRDGSQRRHEPKQVMFSDGIRPGGDLTELDGSNQASSRLPLRRSQRSQKRVDKTSADGGGRRVRSSETQRTQCLIPESGLPPVVMTLKSNEEVTLEENPSMEKYLPQIKDENANPLTFALCSNLHVLTKILTLDCCVNRVCWSFTTQGMCTVGQDEIVIILECLPDEDMIPVDVFRHLYYVYEEAGKGNTVSDMGHSIFTQTFLDDRDHGGFLYIKPTFQCLHKLVLPTPPYLFGILLQKWEMPWAKVFPIRLLLRLGAEYRYYPCPLISIRNRKPVFFEIGHTIMNLLADFRNFQYMLPQIKGITIHMQDKRTTINFPRNRYEDLMKVVENSNEHVMAIGACFSTEADSHLVCIQNDDGNYQTQAINIQNKPRKVTGASFVVFNGALKPSSGLRAKSSIVEDGLMVQITPESMAALKQSIKDMKEFTIGCGPLSSQSPEEVVLIQWVREDKHINLGVKSPIDGMPMDGITSVHIPHATDYAGEHRVIRWTDVFFIENKDGGSREPVDVSHMAETLASAACIALTPRLDQLKEAGLVKLGLRVSLESDKVGYDIGANGEKLPDIYMNDLDNELIPVIHSAVPLCRGGSVVLELIFHILE
ncbi:zinc finger FYVE domain-containing protein 9-like isoform X1 [Saccostrea echinata]|nr:zinc finger FYVE domain-containing protein 9-like isoform X1 [Saccostrea echinata]